MSEINWNELKDKAHSNAVKHGFWEGSYCDDAFDNFLDENEGYFDDEE